MLELCLSSLLGWRWHRSGLPTQCKLHVGIVVPISGREMSWGTCCPIPDDCWLSRAGTFRGLLSLFSILAFNQSLLLITKVFPVGRNPTFNDTNFFLYMHMYKYINKSINSVS